MEATIALERELLGEAGEILGQMRAIFHAKPVRFERPGPAEEVLHELNQLLALKPRLEAAMVQERELLGEAEAILDRMQTIFVHTDPARFERPGPLESALRELDRIFPLVELQYLRRIE
jgi:hypothetical protein